MSPWSDEKYMTRGDLWEQHGSIAVSTLSDLQCDSTAREYVVLSRYSSGATSYRIFHHREEEKGSDVAEAEDVLVDGGERLPQILCPLQH